jgi:hypothetical protein
VAGTESRVDFGTKRWDLNPNTTVYKNNLDGSWEIDQGWDMAVSISKEEAVELLKIMLEERGW